MVLTSSPLELRHRVAHHYYHSMANVALRLPENVPGDFFVDSTCIDCDACVPECPVEAIFADNNVPEQYQHWTQINIDEAPNYPVISQKIPALHGPACNGPAE